MKMKEQLSAIKGMRPMMRIDSTMLPEVKKWDVGGKYRVELELEQVEKFNRDGEIYMDEEYEQENEKGNVIGGEFIIKSAKAI